MDQIIVLTVPSTMLSYCSTATYCVSLLLHVLLVSYCTAVWGRTMCVSCVLHVLLLSLLTHSEIMDEIMDPILMSM